MRSWLIFFLKGLLVVVLTLKVSFGSAIGKEFEVFESNGHYGLKDSKGAVVIEPTFDFIGWDQAIYPEDFIPYKKGNGWGLINLTKKKSKTSNYCDIRSGGEDRIIVKEQSPFCDNNQFYLLDEKARRISGNVYASISFINKGFVISKQDRMLHYYGIIDANEKQLLPTAYLFIRNVNTDCFVVTNHQFKKALWSMDEDKFLTQFKYDSIKSLKDDLVVVYEDGKAGLLNKDGQEVLPLVYKKIELGEAGVIRIQNFPKWTITDEKNHKEQDLYFDNVKPIGFDAMAVNANGTERIVNFEGSTLGSFEGIHIKSLHENVFIYERDQYFGISNLAGDTVLPAVFDSIYIKKKQIFAATEENKQLKWALYDPDGSKITADKYDQLIQWKDKWLVQRLGYWGIVDEHGKEVVTCKYDSIMYSAGEMYQVLFYDEVGIIDENEQWIALPDKHNVQLLSDTSFLHRTVTGSYIHGLQNDTLFHVAGLLYPTTFGFLEKQENGYKAAYDTRFELLVPGSYYQISPLYEDSVIITRSMNGWSLFGKNSDTLFLHDKRYEEMGVASDQYIKVKIDGKWGFVDYLGRLRIANRYEDAQDFVSGTAPVKVNGKWLLLDKLEDFITQPKFDSIHLSADSSFYIVQKDGKYGVYSLLGKEQIPCEFTKIENHGSSFSVWQQDKIGILDNNGKFVVPPKFNSINELGNGYLITEKRSRFGLMTLDGLNIIPAVYDSIVFDPFNNKYFCMKKSKWEVLGLDIQPN